MYLVYINVYIFISILYYVNNRKKRQDICWDALYKYNTQWMDRIFLLNIFRDYSLTVSNVNLVFSTGTCKLGSVTLSTILTLVLLSVNGSTV